MQVTSVYISNRKKKTEGKGFQVSWILHRVPCYKTRLNHSKKYHSKKDFLLHKMYLKPNTNNFPIMLLPEKSPHLLSHPHPLHLIFISPKHMKLIPRANLWVAKPTAIQKQVKSSAHSNKVLYGGGSIQDLRQGRCTGRKTIKIW